MEYKLKGEDAPMPNGTQPPIEAQVIERHGQVQDFTFNDFVSDLLSVRKKLVELKGMQAMEQAKMKNLEDHHPFVKEMNEFDRYTVHMYQESFALDKATQKHIDSFEETEVNILEAIADIKAQIPELADAQIPQVEKPVAPVVDAEVVTPEAPAEEKTDDSGTVAE